MDWTTALYIFYAIIGLGIIIFIHELGHFLAAKLVGVRVHTFSVGFDPPLFGRNLRLFQFRRGETDYVIGMIPLGGYVKMAGETGLSEEAQESELEGQEPQPDWLIAKPAWARALVFAAGAIFNIISAGLFFIIAFSLGVNFTSVTVGDLTPGEAAWEAGIRPGDTVRSVDGEKIDEFHQFLVTVALEKAGEPVEIVVERDGENLPPMRMESEYDAAQGFHSVGIVPILKSELDGVKKGSPAEEAGLKAGDRIVGIRFPNAAFETVPTINILLDLLRQFNMTEPEASFGLRIERNGESRWVDVARRKDPDGESRTLLGVSQFAPFVIDQVQPGSSAAEVFRNGDRLLEVDGKRVRNLSVSTIAPLVSDSQGTVTLQIEGEDGTLREETVAAQTLLEWTAFRFLSETPRHARLGDVGGSVLAGTGLQAGDVLVSVGDEPLRNPDDLGKILQQKTASELTVVFLRDGRRGEPVRVARSGLLDLHARSKSAWNQNFPVDVTGDNYPAARLGIEPGATIERIGGARIESWNDLTEAVSRSGDKPVEVVWTTPGGEEQSGTTKLRVDDYEPSGFVFTRKQVKVQEPNVLAAAKIGYDRTLISAGWVFLTLKGLIKREVAASNLQGPVGIVHLIVRVSDLGLGTLIYFLALISVNLGIFNLLPIPILDGGHLLFLMIEKIKGSPVSLRVQEIATMVCFFLFIGLALFVTYHDVLRLLRF